MRDHVAEYEVPEPVNDEKVPPSEVISPIPKFVVFSLVVNVNAMFFSFEDDPDVTSDDVIVIVGTVVSYVHSNVFEATFPYHALS